MRSGVSEIYDMIERINREFSDGFNNEQKARWAAVCNSVGRLDSVEFKSNNREDLCRSIQNAYKDRVKGAKSDDALIAEVTRVVNRARVTAIPDVAHADENLISELISDLNAGKYCNQKLVSDEKGKENLIKAFYDLQEEIAKVYEQKKAKKCVLTAGDMNSLKSILGYNEAARAQAFLRSLAHVVHSGEYFSKDGGEQKRQTGLLSKQLALAFEKIDAIISEKNDFKTNVESEITGLNELLTETTRKMELIVADETKAAEFQALYDNSAFCDNEISRKMATVADCDNIRFALEQVKSLVLRALNLNRSEAAVKKLEKEFKATDFNDPEAVRRLTEVLQKNESSAPAPVYSSAPSSHAAAGTAAAVKLSPQAQAAREKMLKAMQQKAEGEAKIAAMGLSSDQAQSDAQINKEVNKHE